MNEKNTAVGRSKLSGSRISVKKEFKGADTHLSLGVLFGR